MADQVRSINITPDQINGLLINPANKGEVGFEKVTNGGGYRHIDCQILGASHELLYFFDLEEIMLKRCRLDKLAMIRIDQIDYNIIHH